MFCSKTNHPPLRSPKTNPANSPGTTKKVSPMSSQASPYGPGGPPCVFTCAKPSPTSPKMPSAKSSTESSPESSQVSAAISERERASFGVREVVSTVRVCNSPKPSAKTSPNISPKTSPLPALRRKLRSCRLVDGQTRLRREPTAERLKGHQTSPKTSPPTSPKAGPWSSPESSPSTSP